MNKRNNIITVYEHEVIRSSSNDLSKISMDQLRTLQIFHEKNAPNYYTLINKGVKFCGFVGVLQVGKLTIEVLPKIDKVSEGDKASWKRILLGMLKKVGPFQVSASSETNLKINSNSILDLYIEQFLLQTEKLIHQGLIKKYRQIEANSTALKGKIIFAKNMQKNLIHKEKFFVKYTVYDSENIFNKILFKTLNLINLINTNQALQSKLQTLLLNFPGMPEIKVSESLFTNMTFDRKSDHYRSVMLISKLLLLNYHPDVNTGRNHVLALMFDMNLLWEKFVYASLTKYLRGLRVEQQISKPYWKLNGTRAISLKPDIVLTSDKTKYILDTKWKIPANSKPGYSDLQQMYAYTKYFDSTHTLLCYPGKVDSFINGRFFNEKEKIGDVYPCSIMRIQFDPMKSIGSWQKRICEQVRLNLITFNPILK